MRPEAPSTDSDTPLNEKIAAHNVRLITHDGHNKGIVAMEDALRMAREQSLDLVQMTQDEDPVVCRIMDYGKHQFAKRKQGAVARRNQHRMQVKEVKFRVATEAADYEVKLKRLLLFLGHGDKVKITLRYRGREMMHQELGLQMLERVRDDLSEIGFVEHDPELERRQLSMVIAPYRKGQQGQKPRSGSDSSQGVAQNSALSDGQTTASATANANSPPATDGIPATDTATANSPPATDGIPATDTATDTELG